MSMLYPMPATAAKPTRRFAVPRQPRPLRHGAELAAARPLDHLKGPPVCQRGGRATLDPERPGSPRTTRRAASRTGSRPRPNRTSDAASTAPQIVAKRARSGPAGSGALAGQLRRSEGSSPTEADVQRSPRPCIGPTTSASGLRPEQRLARRASLPLSQRSRKPAQCIRDSRGKPTGRLCQSPTTTAPTYRPICRSASTG